MAKSQKKRKPTQTVAVLRTKLDAKCAFCSSNIDDEVKYGKIYTLGTITCHYYCVLLSSCLVQHGKDDEGLLGFLEQDLFNEIVRGKKLRCNFCGLNGATLACCASVCKRQFHLTCGKTRGCISLFYGNYQSFCVDHGPKQNLPAELQLKVKARISLKTRTIKNRSRTRSKRNSYDIIENSDVTKNKNDSVGNVSDDQVVEQICPICYEDVEPVPSADTLWPPCCRGDRWFHRNCVERMALSAARHYLKCPLCNDKTTFCNAIMNQGVYVPDRDASWELDEGAYSELHERTVRCNADNCLCKLGRCHNVDETCWEVIFCASCGSDGCHIQCLDENSKNLNPPMFRCADCQAVAVPVETIMKALNMEVGNRNSSSSSSRNVRRVQRPVMPARMSLRRAMLSTATLTVRQRRSRESTISGSSNCTESSDKSEKETFSKETVVNITSNHDLDSDIDIEDVSEVISQNDKYNSLKIAPEILKLVKPCPKSKKKKFLRRILNEEVAKLTSSSSSERNSPSEQILSKEIEETSEESTANQAICVITSVEANYSTKDEEKSKNSTEPTESKCSEKGYTSSEEIEEKVENLSISSTESIINVETTKNCRILRNTSVSDKSCDFQCSYDHHANDSEDTKSYLKSVIDFAIDAALKLGHEKSKTMFENTALLKSINKLKKNTKSDKLVDNSKVFNVSNVDNQLNISKFDKPVDSSKVFNVSNVDNQLNISKFDKLVDNSKVFDVSNVDNQLNISKFDKPVDNSKVIDVPNVDNQLNNSKLDNLVDNSKVVDVSNVDNQSNNYIVDKLEDNSKSIEHIDNSLFDKHIDKLEDNSKSIEHIDNSLFDKHIDKLEDNSKSIEHIDNSLFDKHIDKLEDNSKSIEHIDNSLFDKHIDKLEDNSKSIEHIDNSLFDKHIDNNTLNNSSPVFFISTQTANKRKHILTLKRKKENENIIDNVEIQHSQYIEGNECEKYDLLSNGIEKYKLNELVDNPKWDGDFDNTKFNKLAYKSKKDKMDDNRKKYYSFDNALLDELDDKSEPIFFQTPNKTKHLLTVKTKIGKENIIDNVEVSCEIEGSHNKGDKVQENNTSNNVELDNSNQKTNIYNIADNSNPILTTRKSFKRELTKNNNIIAIDDDIEDSEVIDLTNTVEDTTLDDQNTKINNKMIRSYQNDIDNLELIETLRNDRKSTPIFLDTKTSEKRKNKRLSTFESGNVPQIMDSKKRISLRLGYEQSLTETLKKSKLRDSNRNPKNSKLEINIPKSQYDKNKRKQSDATENYIKKSHNNKNDSKASDHKTKRIKSDEDIEKLKETNIFYVSFGAKTTGISQKRILPSDSFIESKKTRAEKNYTEKFKDLGVLKNQIKTDKCILESTKIENDANEIENKSDTKIKNRKIINNYNNNEKIDFVYLKLNDKSNSSVANNKSCVPKMTDTENCEPKMVFLKTDSWKTKKKYTDNNLSFLSSASSNENYDSDDEIIFTPKKTLQNGSEAKKYMSENISTPTKNKNSNEYTNISYDSDVEEIFTPKKKLHIGLETKKNICDNISSPSKYENNITNFDDKVIFKTIESKPPNSEIDTIIICDEENASYSKDSNSSTENYDTNITFNSNSENIQLKLRKSKKEAFKLKIKCKSKHSNKIETKRNNSKKTFSKSQNSLINKNVSPSKILIQTHLKLSRQRGETKNNFLKVTKNSEVKKKTRKILKKNKDSNLNMIQTTIGKFFAVSP